MHIEVFFIVQPDLFNYKMMNSIISLCSVSKLMHITLLKINLAGRILLFQCALNESMSLKT